MTGKIQVFFSNRVELLYRDFKEAVYAPPCSPFARRLVIVPSPALKSWLMLQLAKDPDVGIAAGLEIGYLDEIIEKLRSLFSVADAEPKRVPSLLELGLAIEVELRKAIKFWPKMSLPEKEVWGPLFQYLHIQSDKTLSRKSERRLLALAGKLAQLFRQYGKYGHGMVLEWEKEIATGWQQQLWRLLFQKKTGWTYLYRELIKNIHPPADIPDIQVHLFSISYIPPLFFNYLEKIAQSIPVYEYLLSPCQYFWSDVRSDKETRRLSTFWKRMGISEQQQITLDAFLRDRNPLLANFGRLGREMAQLVENGEAETFENYALPQAIEDHPQYQSFLEDSTELSPSSFPLTLLQAVQADMLLLRNPAQSPKISFRNFDGSIQIHSSCTRLREVEALYDRLVGIMLEHAKEDDPITAGDIIVMAPDILEYEPFIKMVFQGSESQLDVHVMDLNIPAQNLLVQSFMHLLAMPGSRWDAVTILQLFEYPAFQRRQQLTHEDIDQVRDWIKDAGISWGSDGEHRNELLQRDHCAHEMTEQASSGTWEFGIARLLSGLAIQASSDEDSVMMHVHPLKVVATQSDLLGKLIRLLHSLREDLRPLSDGSSFTLKDWASYLQCLYQAYFSEDGNEANDFQNSILAPLNALRSASRYFPNEKFTFASIKKHLDSELSQKSAIYRESHLNAVRFCSLIPMRTIPAKVIVLLGMQEGCYPRRDQTVSLNLLTGHAKADYFPSQTEFDRYLFLEALLSARRYFILSHLGYSQKDLKELAPSLLVTELSNYLDKAFEIGGSKPSELCHFKHPFQAFDSTYFKENSRLKSYSKSYFDAASAYYHVQKKPAFNFIREYTILNPKKLENEIRLNIRDLQAFAKNPLKIYFNKKLGIYLEKEEDRIIETEESFLLSYLEIDELKKMVLFKPMDEVIRYAQKKGILPGGLFKHVSIETLKRQSEELKNNLSAVNVNPQDLFQIEFSEHCRKAEQTDQGHWLLPPLKMDYKGAATIKVVGKLENVSPQGLVAFVRKNNVARAWPQYLVYQCLAKEHALDVKAHLILAKDGDSKPNLTDNPHEALEHYLEYYFTGLEHASPLIPEWIPHFLNYDEQGLKDKLKEAVDNDQNPLYNEYVDWLLKHSTIPENIGAWKEHAQKVFGNMQQQWFK